jgi:hypothetical protein
MHVTPQCTQADGSAHHPAALLAPHLDLLQLKVGQCALQLILQLSHLLCPLLKPLPQLASLPARCSQLAFMPLLLLLPLRLLLGVLCCCHLWQPDPQVSLPCTLSKPNTQCCTDSLCRLQW